MTSAKRASKNNNPSLGSINLNMQTDAGKIAGEIFAEPKFIDNLRSFSEKNTNNAARQAVL